MMLLTLIAPNNLSAQRVVLNQNGDKIVLYQDGSWRYFDPEVHADLLNKNPESENYPQINTSVQVSPDIQAGAVQERILRKAQESAILETKILKELDEQRLQAETLRAQLKKAQTDPNTSVSELVQLEKEYENTQKLLDRKQDQYKAAVKRTRSLQRMLQLPPKKQAKALAKLERTGSGKKSKSKKKSRKSRKKDNDTPIDHIANAQPEKMSFEPVNVMLYPPKQPCSEVKTKMDEFSGNFVRHTEPQVLFTYTSEQLRPYFKDRSYITGKTSIESMSEGPTLLKLEIEIASALAQREFGAIEKGASLLIKMISGKSVLLKALQRNTGFLDSSTDVVTYIAEYALDKDKIDDLKNGEIDAIRMVWSAGYEDYPVYHLDAIAHQLNCLR